VAFFTQIDGDKEYHAYPPTQVSEPELEEFYSRGRVSIGQLDMATLDTSQEYLYKLKAGHGFHQPQNSPHWVQTRGTRSISYSMVFETTADKALGLTRAFNHFERKLGMKPAVPGAKPTGGVLPADVSVAADGRPRDRAEAAAEDLLSRYRAPGMRRCWWRRGWR
jgi:hypothetical protein